MAETFVNLVTGATLPDRGVVTIFGRPTSSIDDSAEWLAVVDRFGIVSERAVLLDALSVIQNLSIPFTLEIEPPPDDVRERAAALAREVGLEEHDWSRPVADLDAAGRLRLRAGTGPGPRSRCAAARARERRTSGGSWRRQSGPTSGRLLRGAPVR